jgi:hypothetical protein
MIQSCQAGDHEGLREARPPKRKEEYVPLEKIDEVGDEILNAGTHLASVSSVDFPDAESVSNPLLVCPMLSNSMSWLGSGSGP